MSELNLGELNQAKDALRRMAVLFEGCVQIADALDRIISLQGMIDSLSKRVEELDQLIQYKTNVLHSLEETEVQAHVEHEHTLAEMKITYDRLNMRTQAEAENLLKNAREQAAKIISEAKDTLESQLTGLRQEIANETSQLAEVKAKRAYSRKAADAAEAHRAEVQAELDKVNEQINSLASRSKS